MRLVLPIANEKNKILQYKIQIIKIYVYHSWHYNLMNTIINIIGSMS